MLRSFEKNGCPLPNPGYYKLQNPKIFYILSSSFHISSLFISFSIYYPYYVFYFILTVYYPLISVFIFFVYFIEFFLYYNSFFKYYSSIFKYLYFSFCSISPSLSILALSFSCRNVEIIKIIIKNSKNTIIHTIENNNVIN